MSSFRGNSPPGSPNWRKSATGSSNHVARAMLLVDPPDIDKGEVTDKGSINQRAVRTARPELVEALYAETLPDPTFSTCRARRRSDPMSKASPPDLRRCPGLLGGCPHALRRLSRRLRQNLADRPRHQGGPCHHRSAPAFKLRPISVRPSSDLWHRPRSTPTTPRAISGFMPAPRPRRRHIWCSASAAPVSRSSPRRADTVSLGRARARACAPARNR